MVDGVAIGNGRDRLAGLAAALGLLLLVRGELVGAPELLACGLGPGTTLANCTTGTITHDGATIPTPTASFNVQNII